jgi:DNA-binding NarL/FixJ family response regulator
MTARSALWSVSVRTRRPRGPKLSPAIPTPLDLRATRASVGAEKLVVFSLPLGPPALPETLSPAERAIALALLDGRSNSEIAKARRTSVRTVANQLASLFRKLGVGSRAEAVASIGRLRRS